MSSDERYIEVDGRRWRRADPSIPASLKSELVSELMSARRAVKSAQDDADKDALTVARERVHDAKIALGERGQPWWEDPEEDAVKIRLAAGMRALLRKRGPDKTICPSEAARVADGERWRPLMATARQEAWRLAEDGWLDVLQSGECVTPPVEGPIRLKKRR
jgi:hypothetical protein